MARAAESTGRNQRGRPFAPGTSGNPAGRPRGSKHVALKALDAIGCEAAAELVETAVGLAKSGDIQALKLVLDRIWPARKGSPRPCRIPIAEGAVPAADAVLDQVAAGEITAEEGAVIMGLLDARRRAVEHGELVARIEALEART